MTEEFKPDSSKFDLNKKPEEEWIPLNKKFGDGEMFTNRDGTRIRILSPDRSHEFIFSIEKPKTSPPAPDLSNT